MAREPRTTASRTFAEASHPTLSSSGAVRSSPKLTAPSTPATCAIVRPSTSAVSLTLIPVFGLTFSVLLLGDDVSPRLGIAALAVLAGLMITSRAQIESGACAQRGQVGPDGPAHHVFLALIDRVIAGDQRGGEIEPRIDRPAPVVDADREVIDQAAAGGLLEVRIEKTGAGNRCARYLVQLWFVAFFNSRMA